MLKFNELKQIHLEITNNCQASCPMCSRNIHGGVENSLIQLESWSLERYKKIINEEVLNQVNFMYFCGNYGDPLLNNSLLNMIKYTVDINPNIHISIHTNGSLRTTSWWETLAGSLPKNHAVVFAIDGLEDTHSIYRMGTDFNKIITNATAFIKAGGNAEWAYIRFRHNEHQVGEAKRLAATLGFKNFTLKDSSRFLLDAKFPVYDKDRNVTHYLEPSGYSELKFIDKNILIKYKEIVKETIIDCHALKTKEIYITAQGHIFPCCWLAMIPYQPMDENIEVWAVRKHMLDQYYELAEALGGIDNLNGEKRTIKEVIDSHEYQTVWDSFWSDNKLITCARSCGVMPEIFSTPRDQFSSKEILNVQN